MSECNSRSVIVDRTVNEWNTHKGHQYGSMYSLGRGRMSVHVHFRIRERMGCVYSVRGNAGDPLFLVFCCRHGSPSALDDQLVFVLLL